MKSINSWVSVEPILERRRISKSNEKVWTTEVLQTWKPDSLLRLDVLNKWYVASVARRKFNNPYIFIHKIKTNDDTMFTEHILRKNEDEVMSRVGLSW